MDIICYNIQNLYSHSVVYYHSPKEKRIFDLQKYRIKQVFHLRKSNLITVKKLVKNNCHSY